MHTSRLHALFLAAAMAITGEAALACTVDLARIAPRGLIDRRVAAYVADDPLYLG